MGLNADLMGFNGILMGNIHIHTHTQTHTHTHIHTHIHIHIHIYIYCNYTYDNICIYKFIYIMTYVIGYNEWDTMG